MSDPEQIPKRKPPRAEPLQPDRPGRGHEEVPADTPGDGERAAEPATAEQQRSRSEDALENVRKGYD